MYIKLLLLGIRFPIIVFMKKALIILSILLILLVLLPSSFYVYNIFFVPGGYKKSETITPYDFLDDKNPNRWEELHLNKKGDIVYKNKIIVKDNEVVFEFFLIGKDKINYTDMISLKRKASDEIYINKKGDLKPKNKVIIKHNKIPLNGKTAFTDLELIMYYKAKGSKPRKDCDPKDWNKNGHFGIGCYISSLDNN